MGLEEFSVMLSFSLSLSVPQLKLNIRNVMICLYSKNRPILDYSAVNPQKTRNEWHHHFRFFIKSIVSCDNFSQLGNYYFKTFYFCPGAFTSISPFFFLVSQTLAKVHFKLAKITPKSLQPFDIIHCLLWIILTISTFI